MSNHKGYLTSRNAKAIKNRHAEVKHRLESAIEEGGATWNQWDPTGELQDLMDEYYRVTKDVEEALDFAADSVSERRRELLSLVKSIERIEKRLVEQQEKPHPDQLEDARRRARLIAEGNVIATRVKILTGKPLESWKALTQPNWEGEVEEVEGEVA